MFSRDRLSTAVMAALTSLAGTTAYAQQEDSGIVEEVMVTGIRASVQAAMDVKRDASGVVDAISAEDIGKFPDTNLAESLQRITGVSIDRSNGEGSRITVRGFGPDFNMVTLNGRVLPGGSAYGGSSGADNSSRGGNGRAFDFANLAAEAVSGVEVYKTGKANIPAGGIGATVNIRTSRPLDNPGLSASVSVKGLHDTTVREGEDLTPELSGLLSWSDDSDRFGASLSASYQERDSGYIGATVNEWHIGTWGEGQSLYSRDFDDAIYQNTPEVGQLYARPNDIRYAFSDRHRERTNAQLTLQFAPVENIIGTVDFTYANNDQQEHRGEVTNWVQNGAQLSRVVFDDSAIATPIMISEDYSGSASEGRGTRDIGFSQQFRSQEDELQSIGFNLAWDVNEQLSLALDVHNSEMDSLPTAPGNVGEIDIGLGSQVKQGKTLYYGGDLPTWEYTSYDADGDVIQEQTIDDCAFQSLALANDPNDPFTTNCNGELDAGDISSTVMRMWSAEQRSEVTQLRLDGAWEFDDGRFDFGFDRNELETTTTTYNGNNAQVLGGWGADNPGEFPEGLIEFRDVASEFEDFNTGTSPNIGFYADARELANYLVQAPQYAGQRPYIGVEASDGRNSRDSSTVEEETTAVYGQVNLEGEIGGMTFGVLTGLRYETTDVTSTSDTPLPQYLNWASDNDFQAVSGAAGAARVVEHDYDALLPNLDLSLNITENIIGRFSFSKTIARPALNDLSAAVGQFGLTGSTLLGSVPRAVSGNPQLDPLESTNFDLSFEYYFADTSYVSAGLWEKRVINFVGNAQETETWGEGDQVIRDQTAGPRALAARDALLSLGQPVDSATLHAMMVILDNPTDFPDGAAEFRMNRVADLNEGDEGGSYDLTPLAEDPAMQILTSAPINSREAKIHGLELAVQHFFGDTGFGVMANYTLVRGDVNFNDLGDPTTEQFALLGLSDTANLVLMYENFGVQARLAYNWRDEFLGRTNVQSARNPGYTEAYSQIDFNVSYDVTDNIAVSFEGINLTGEDRREHARNDTMLFGLEDLGARYLIGARYSF